MYVNREMLYVYMRWGSRRFSINIYNNIQFSHMERVIRIYEMGFPSFSNKYIQFSHIKIKINNSLIEEEDLIEKFSHMEHFSPVPTDR